MGYINGEGVFLKILEAPLSFIHIWARGPKQNGLKDRPERGPVSKSRVKSRTPDILLILLLVKGTGYYTEELNCLNRGFRPRKLRWITLQETVE